MAAKRTEKPKKHFRRAENPRDAAMRLLKIRGEMTTLELTRALELTETAVRRHIHTLTRQGYITHRLEHGTNGRPSKRYRLTEKATTDYFPKGYEELAGRLLDTVYEIGGHQQVFEYLLSCNQALVKKLMLDPGETSLKERVTATVQFFESNGYMTDYRELTDGSFFLYHQNCSIFNLASKYRQLCLVELRLIEELARAKVQRKQYIFKGQPICGYMIVPHKKAKQSKKAL